MDERYNQIQAGWRVEGSDGDKIGDVEEVGPDYLLVTKGLIFRTDLYVPFTAVGQVDPADGRVMLSMPKSDIDESRWSEPPLRSETAAGSAWAAGDMTAGTSMRGTADEPVTGLGYTGRPETTKETWADDRTPVGSGVGTTYRKTAASDTEVLGDRDRDAAPEAAGAGAGAVGGAVVGGALGGPPGAVVGGAIGAAGGAAAGDAAEDAADDDDVRREDRDLR